MSRSKPIFKGIATALVTPFRNGAVDFVSMGKLIDIQLENNVAAIVVCGTTGEASTISSEEYAAIVKFAVSRVNGAVPVIVGSGSNCTAKAVETSKLAEELGADTLLIVTPYYNKASPEGLIRHYTAIADSVSIPIILYNVPSRTGVDIPVEVYQTLSLHPNIKGIKEARGNAETVKKLRSDSNPLQIFSGNDIGLCDMMDAGALGCISVASNIIPREMVALCDLYFSGDRRSAIELETKLTPLFNALFCEVNPIPLKYAMGLMGLCGDEMRLPLCSPSKVSQEFIKRTVSNFHLT